MAKIYKSVEELIGNTPLLELTKIEKGTGATLLAKVEALNPGGSAKDRIAKRMVEDAEKAGILKEGATIIEPTSGNTGIGLALMAAARGYRAIIVMPDSMSMERRLLMTAFGAELVLTEGKQGMKGAVEKAEELAKEIPNSFIAGQFVNPSNPAAHYETTGPEIWADTDGGPISSSSYAAQRNANVTLSAPSDGSITYGTYLSCFSSSKYVKSSFEVSMCLDKS